MKEALHCFIKDLQELDQVTSKVHPLADKTPRKVVMMLEAQQDYVQGPCVGQIKEFS